MKQLKIKDNERRSKTDFYEINAVVKCITDKTLGQLEREGVFVFPKFIKDADDIAKDQMILQSCNDMYYSGNVMGFLGVGEERLIIESRFSNGENDYFTQYLLEKVMKFPNLVDFSIETNQEERLFNWLLFLFPRYLRQAMRKGLFKTYIHNVYNDENVKGTIDVDRHIRVNTPFIGNITYSQREYSYDNYLMELVRHTIEFIKQKSYGNRLLKSAKDEVKQVVEATSGYKASDRRKIVIINKKNVVRHAYFHEYRELQQLCIQILQNEKHQFGNGSGKVYGVLFDGAWLWEEYVNTLIADTFYHPRNKAGENAQRLFSNNTGLIYPDFISRDSVNRVIADAKYKPMDNIGNKDYLQLLAYMFRFDAKRGYYLYPETTENSNLQLYLNRGSTYEKDVRTEKGISVIKHGLRMPENAVEYKEFEEKMQVEEEKFRGFVNNKSIVGF